MNKNLLTFLVHCHLHSAALTQHVVGEDGTDLPYSLCNLDEDHWCQGEGAAVVRWLLATIPGAEKAVPASPSPRSSFTLVQNGDLHRAQLQSGSGVGCFSCLM